MMTLDAQARTGLKWLRSWARSELTRYKRRRKYLTPPRANIAPDEQAWLQALIDLERAAAKLLGDEVAK